MFVTYTLQSDTHAVSFEHDCIQFVCTVNCICVKGKARVEYSRCDPITAGIETVIMAESIRLQLASRLLSKNLRH